MCGRFTLTQFPEAIREIFGLSPLSEFSPRYNIAPSQSLSAIVDNNQSPQLTSLKWGLIPRWSKDPKIGNRLINARAETLAEKPSFRSAFKHRRCLILADGFYEWSNRDGHKQPYYFQLHPFNPFVFAGLWETWQSEAGQTIETCTIITTTANDLIQPIHPRMPVILPPMAYPLWLKSTTPPDILQSLLVAYDSQEMRITPVGTIVNNPAHDEPECIKPFIDQADSQEGEQ